jgi:GABA permease
VHLLENALRSHALRVRAPGPTDTTGRGVPAKAILLGTVIGYIAVLMAYFFPDTVFLFLLNSSGAVALFVYLLIAVSELRMQSARTPRGCR